MLADQIARDPVAYEEIGMRAAAYGRKYHIENVAREYEKIFRHVLKYNE